MNFEKIQTFAIDKFLRFKETKIKNLCIYVICLILQNAHEKPKKKFEETRRKTRIKN